MAMRISNTRIVTSSLLFIMEALSFFISGDWAQPDHFRVAEKAIPGSAAFCYPLLLRDRDITVIGHSDTPNLCIFEC